MQEAVADVVTFFAAMVGTDFNGNGLRQYGPAKATDVTKEMYHEWKKVSCNESRGSDFLDFAHAVVCNQIALDAPKDALKAFLKKVWQECEIGHGASSQVPADKEGDQPFHQQLATVTRVVRAERQAAMAAARAVRSESIPWSGSRIMHAEFMELLREVGAPEESQCRRLMILEAERMLRSSEGECTAFVQISGLSKAKQFKEAADGTTDVCIPLPSRRHSDGTQTDTLTLFSVAVPLSSLSATCWELATC
jgi:hypothetical protein